MGLGTNFFLRICVLHFQMMGPMLQ